MKYKVGDKVRIKSLEVLKNHPKINPEGYMNKYFGQIAEIINIKAEGIYNLDIDQEDRHGMGWFWHEDMLEDVTYRNMASQLISGSRIVSAFCDFPTINELATKLDINVTHPAKSQGGSILKKK